MRLVWSLVWLSACGRVGFDRGVTPGTGDGGSAGDALVIDAIPTDVMISTLCPNATLIGHGTRPSLAWNGSGFGVAFLDGSEVRFAPISAAGVPGTSNIFYTGGTGFDLPSRTTITWDGVDWVAASDGLGIHAAKLSTTGAIIQAATTIDGATNSYTPAFALGGTGLRLQWIAYANMNFQLMTGQLSATLTTAATQVSSSSWGALNGAGVGTPTGWGLVWDDSKLNAGCVQHGIYFQPVRANGQLQGNSSQSYQCSCTNSGNSESHAPQAVWNGSDLSVAWNGTGTDPSHVYVARMDPGTGALTTAPIVPTSAASAAASLVWTGSELGIAWAGNGVVVTRASADGTPIAEIAFDAAGTTPSIAWDGAHYALAWERAGDVYFAATCP